MKTSDHVGLVLAEYLDSRALGESPARADYFERHPQLRNRLEEHFSTIDGLEQLLGRPQPTTARRRLGRYRLLRELGHGGMGVVFLAAETGDGRLVALKVLGRAMELSAERVARFEREAQITHRLRHPNLVAVYDAGEVDGFHYLAMQYVRGVTLAQLITRLRQLNAEELRRADLAGLVRELAGAGDLSAVEPAADIEPQADIKPAMDGDGVLLRPPTQSRFAAVARLVSEIADALHYLHRHDVVHRDVKPHNVLLDTDMTPFLADFGLARDASLPALSATGDRVGTPHYMSPEVARGGQVDGRSDVFSLGVTLYELLTLALPVTGLSERTLHQVGRQRADPGILHRGVPADLRAITMRAMASDPADRYATAHQLAEDLRRFLRHDEISVPQPGVAARCLAYGARHRRGLGGCLAVLLVGLSWLVATSLLRDAEWRRLQADGRRLLAAGDYFPAAYSLRQALELRATAALRADLDRAVGRGCVVVDSDPPGAQVTVRALDPWTGVAGAATDFGVTDADSGRLALNLDPGEYLVVVASQLGFGEYLTSLVPRQAELRLVAALRATAAVTADMVWIPGGRYTIGRTEPTDGAFVTDKPLQTVQLKPFYIDRYEVTNDRYREFVIATRHRPPPHWINDAPKPGTENLPVVKITWHDAVAYAEWAGKRLPTDDEWEAAARGPEGLVYSWGNDFAPNRAVLGPKLEAGVLLPAGQGLVDARLDTGDRTATGVLHMIGNVQEWVLGRWNPRPAATPHPAMLPDGRRVTRGGDYRSPSGPGSARASARIALVPNDRTERVGFRCAKTASR